MWPLLDFVEEKEGLSKEEIAKAVMEEMKEKIEWEIKRAIDEVVCRLQKGLQR
jgi:hypothetical protein